MIVKKSCIAIALAGVMTLGTGITSQAISDTDIICYNSEEIMKKPVSIDTNIGVEGLAYQKDGYLMLPLRLTCERLGMDVKWVGETRSVEISKDSIWTSITLEKDSYFQGRMAPFSLGIAPELIDESTYVPAEFFNEIFDQDVFDIFERNKVDGTVSNIIETKNGKLISVEYDENKIIFIVNDNTKIADKFTNQELNVDDIEEGDRLIAIHDSKMTMSLPPQTYAYSINVEKADTIKGVTSNITQTKNGHMLTVDYDENKTIIFNISDETKITDQTTGEIKDITDIKNGDELVVKHSKIMTKSIPPQTVAYEIQICSNVKDK
ncbi:hypothetical protein SH1V18_46190 [Vallitalea longa]|uniref:Copper amine oxidase-like N-terminal domain-containing protein n=1 Tax=Vallitalea longa TaxID=2936439 RepID=A0A9W5YHQ6_9FIRM|nr:copper amine oxidase N-terminal domain-containing protein [Vallitalea longa]GKX32139.1 hypothetical protein SH1V18_46190 [Vallitalea longa]